MEGLPKVYQAVAAAYYAAIMSAHRLIDVTSVSTLQQGPEWVYRNRLAKLKVLAEFLPQIQTALPAIDLRQLPSSRYDPNYPIYVNLPKTVERGGGSGVVLRTYFVPNECLFYVFRGEAIQAQYMPDSMDFIGYPELASVAEASELIEVYTLEWVIENLSFIGELPGTPERTVDCDQNLLRIISKATAVNANKSLITQLQRAFQDIDIQQRQQADTLYLREEARYRRILAQLLDRMQSIGHKPDRLLHVKTIRPSQGSRRYRMICYDTRRQRIIYFPSTLHAVLGVRHHIQVLLHRERSATQSDVAQVAADIPGNIIAAMPASIYLAIVGNKTGFNTVDLESW